MIAEIAFAVYLMTTGKYSASSNPSIIAMGQMFFSFLFSLILWIGESFLHGTSLTLPKNADFWISAIYISFFIRGLFGIVQVYAQKYVEPLNASLIFATEIVISMAVLPIFSRFYGTPPEKITLLRIIGGVIIMTGVLISEGFTGTLGTASKNNTVRKTPKHYWLYTIPIAIFFGVSGFFLEGLRTAELYAILGFLAGIPVTILIEGVLCLVNFPDDAVFCLENGGESLESANKIIEAKAEKCGITSKRINEIQSCIEEISIRVFDAIPDAKINISIRFGEAISARLSYSGRKYNPLKIEKDEDEFKIAGLKIIRHRALRASFARRSEENKVHVVV